MQSNVIDSLQAAVDSNIPLRDGIVIIAGAVSNRLDELFPEERALIDSAVDRRQEEYSTARALARTAMAELGLPVAPILRGKQREPLWPRGAVGSLTHADVCAAACVARQDAARSVGLDIEVADRVGENLHGKLFTDRERAWLAVREPKFAGLLFSAKEAVYKATFPIVGRFIGFHEAELTVDEARGRISFSYVGDHPPNSVMESAECRFLFSGPYVLSLVIIH